MIMEVCIFLALGLLLLTVIMALVSLVIVLIDFFKENQRYNRRLK